MMFYDLTLASFKSTAAVRAEEDYSPVQSLTAGKVILQVSWSRMRMCQHIASDYTDKGQLADRRVQRLWTAGPPSWDGVSGAACSFVLLELQYRIETYGPD